MSFAKRLKEIREGRHLSQQQLADELRVAQSTIGMWESGRRTPKLDELSRLAKTLHIGITQLIDKRQVEVTKNAVVVDGQKIDIKELGENDIKDIVEYINYLKSKNKGNSKVHAPKLNQNAKRVLVIDDEQDVCEMLYSFLAPHNYKVFLAFNGQMGLECFEEVKPDLILLDLKMPDISGVEVLKIIRKVSDVPVVILTGHPEEVSEIHLSGIKIEGYIEKPVALKVILNTIKHVIGE